MAVEFVDSEAVADRRQWIAVLAKASGDAIKSAWSAFPEALKPETTFLRAPEFGLAMVRGRAGSAGEPFNLGEMTITRCTVRSREGITGTSYVQGRDKERAVIAATVDAMMQNPALRPETSSKIVEPLRQLTEEEKQATARKVAATKVDFFTMVRSREGK